MDILTLLLDPDSSFELTEWPEQSKIIKIITICCLHLFVSNLLHKDKKMKAL